MSEREHPTDEPTARMTDVDHTHPHTGTPFGSVYRRGVVTADGGEDAPVDADRDREEMRDVEHTAPHGDGAAEVWDRGPAAEADADASAEPGDAADAEDHDVPTEPGE